MKCLMKLHICSHMKQFVIFLRPDNINIFRFRNFHIHFFISFIDSNLFVLGLSPSTGRKNSFYSLSWHSLEFTGKSIFHFTRYDFFRLWNLSMPFPVVSDWSLANSNTRVSPKISFSSVLCSSTVKCIKYLFCLTPQKEAIKTLFNRDKLLSLKVFIV